MLRINAICSPCAYRIHMGLLLYATGRQPLHVVPGVHHPQGTRTPGRPAPHAVEKFCHWQKRKLRAPRREVRAGKNRGTCTLPLPPAPWPETAFLGGGRHSCHRLHGGVRRVLEGCDLSLLVLMFLRLLCVMGREEHQRELAAFLAFDIEAVSQVAYLLILILYAEVSRLPIAYGVRRLPIAGVMPGSRTIRPWWYRARGR